MPQGPTFTCLPWFQSWIVFYSILHHLLQYIHVHPPTPLLSLFTEIIPFHFKCVEASFWMKLLLTVLPLMQNLRHQPLTLVCGVDGLCITLHFRFCLTSMLSETGWRSSLRSQAEVTLDALLTPWQLFAAHLAGKFVQRASVMSTVYIALGVIAVNPVISTGVYAFQKRKIA